MLQNSKQDNGIEFVASPFAGRALEQKKDSSLHGSYNDIPELTEPPIAAFSKKK